MCDDDDDCEGWLLFVCSFLMVMVGCILQANPVSKLITADPENRIDQAWVLICGLYGKLYFYDSGSMVRILYKSIFCLGVARVHSDVFS